MLIGVAGVRLIAWHQHRFAQDRRDKNMAHDQPAVAAPVRDERQLGVFAALGAYGVWGFFPVLFRALEAVNPVAVVANRVVWSFFLVGAILWQRGRLPEVRTALSNWPSLRGVLLSSVLLSVNWLVFVWAVDAGRVLEVSFGYFINPLVSVAIGMVLLGERLNRWQTLAIAVALIAVAIQSAGLGQFPVVSLTLALCFGFYGYIRKTVNVGSAAGLFVETLVMLPFAAGYIIFTLVTGGSGPYTDLWLLGLLILTGPATSGALILFAYAARRLPLSLMGMFQYIAPSMHFVIAIWWFGEPLNQVQLLSFALIWVSLAIYTGDSWQRGQVARRLAPLSGPR